MATSKAAVAKKVTSFDVLDKMCADNLDIRMAPVGNILNMRMTKAGTQITIGVGGNVIGALMKGELTACLLLYSVKQFKDTESMLIAAPPAAERPSHD